jgi:hypothetical protein
VISVVTTEPVAADAFSRDRSYSGRSWRGDLAELLIYDRPLSRDERVEIESYLAAKYQLFVPTVAPPTIVPPGGWAPETGTDLVQVDSATPDAVVHFTTDDSEPTESSPVYSEPFEITGPVRIRARAFLPGWSPSRETAVTFLAPDAFTPASLSDLALWVRADAGVGASGASWSDQGEAGNHLHQSHPVRVPATALDESTRMPLLRFDGATGAGGDALHFTEGLAGIRTVFWVVRAEEGVTGYRFLLGDASRLDFCSGSGAQIWSSWYASTAIRNGETRLNGEVVDGTITERPTSLSVISLVTTGDVSADAFSRDRTYTGRSWHGDLAELIIYNRALSPEEVRSVEEFLAARYDIGLVP